jgi:pSer/pThr/pTyr-binding forkhead associated (FHA) protein
METSKQPVARLRWGSEERLLYPDQSIRLGRAPDNDIILNDTKVSRSHAQLEWNGAGFTLRDLGSVNGTFVNGQRLANAARMLHDGDEIILSKQLLVYEIVRAEPAAPPPSPAAMGPTEPLGQMGSYLFVSAGPDLGQEYPLWGEAITIGRASREATWEIRLTDRAVSRPHARLERREEGFYLVDLESANGTLLNGIPVQAPSALKDGDVISVGETRLTFRAT